MYESITRLEIVGPGLIALIVALAASPIAIPMLRKLKFGQNVRDDGPQSHLAKQGTPTMGGIIILLALALGTVFFVGKHKSSLVVLLTTLGYGFVGFLDDFLKIKKHQSEGLKPWQKMTGQFLVTLVFGIYIFKFSEVGTQMYVPVLGKIVDTKWFFFPLMFLVMLGTVNGSNFTDGLDGLASTVTVVIALFFLVTAGGFDPGTYPVITAMIGALLGFLCFNCYPAKIFMGDTGSLALGGFVASTAYMQRMPLIIVLVAFIYLIEVISVILQVAYFKKTGGKRIFKMAPIHHHFELSGWHETKVVAIFSIVTAVLSAFALLIL